MVKMLNLTMLIIQTELPNLEARYMPSKDDVISNIQTITKQMNEILLIIKENKRKGINEGNNVNLLALKEI